ncbi:MAG: family 78 glycoside hydrolase catalytic domain [Acidobacteria bacterium]|nr:family 78 glycoside hydrolase catalytic domain [Acidobacteriota bacterium]
MFRACVLAFLVLPSAMASIRPYALECEARRNPVGIDVERPRLSWKLVSEESDQRQSAYEVHVASSVALLGAGRADIWQSGRVASVENAWIPYGGAGLNSLTRYWWKVRVWDGGGRPSEWSEPAEWTTALVNPAGWRAAWIAHPDHSLRSGPLPMFRKDVTIDRPVRQALALIAGVGFHELHINGAKAGDHVLAPAWTNYRATVMYETFDVTTMVKPGTNAIGVMLGNGFYNVAGGRYTKYTGSFGHPRLSMQLNVQFEDGTSLNVFTDGTWKTAHGPVIFSCIFGGEDYDARLEQPGWDRAGFDDSSWLRVTSVQPPGGEMRAQASPPIRVQQTFQAVKVTEPKPGVRVYDLGQNFSGWPAITASGPAGASVRMIPGELLDARGMVSQGSSGGPVSFTYTLKGQGRESWAPRFTYYGFRYVQIESAATIHNVEGQFVHLDAPRTGSFKCSNERFNRIHALIDAAARSNLQHVLTDCPHREKLGWLEVSYLMGPSLLYNWDLRTFFPKIAGDMREAQLTSGLVPDIAPEYTTFRGGFRDSPEWWSASVFIPWYSWKWYGDRGPVESSYKSMQAYVAYLATRARDGLLWHGLGDWYDIGPRPPGASQLTPLGLTATATWYMDLVVLGRAAALLGDEEGARRFAAQAAQVRESFQKAFFKPAQNNYATGSQTSLAMPLVAGLAPEQSRAALVERLADDIAARGNHTSAGDVGYTYVISALLEAGRSDAVFRMANEETAPSYAAQLAAGATSLTEAWDAGARSSQNHLMLGHVEQWFYAGLAGIRPDPAAPGWRHLVIQPEPVGDIRWVKASVETPRGPVTVDWRVEDKKFILNVSIPPGVSATVRLPSGAAHETGSGRRQFSSTIPSI